MRDNFLHFLTLKQAIQDGGTGSNPASIIFRTRHRLKPYAGDDAPSGLRPCGGGMRCRAHALRYDMSCLRHWEIPNLHLHSCRVGLKPYARGCRTCGATGRKNKKRRDFSRLPLIKIPNFTYTNTNTVCLPSLYNGTLLLSLRQMFQTSYMFSTLSLLASTLPTFLTLLS